MDSRSARVAHLAIIFVCLAGASAAPVAAAEDSFNLDFEGTYTGLPSTFGAASGQEGVWVDVPGNSTLASLVNIDGMATSVSVTLTGLAALDPAPENDAGILMRDAMVSQDQRLVFSVVFSGLADGDYDLWYYSRDPTFDLIANNEPLPNLFGGSDFFWEQGSNFEVFRVRVTGGMLTIGDRSPGADGLSGVQLVHIPPATGESLNLDFGEGYPDVPDTYGAAAGQTGPWVDVPPQLNLYYPVNVAGQKTSLGIRVTGTSGGGPAGATDTAMLLGDEIQTDLPEFPFNATIMGLLNGIYDVYYYRPQSIGGLTLNGVVMPETAGGGTDALGVQGSNWNMLRTTVSDGMLVFDEAIQSFNAGLAGVQVIYVPPPTQGHSYNIDFADYYDGVPGTFGGAAGQPGHWEVVGVDAPIVLDLLDVAGETTPASIIVTGDPNAGVVPTTDAGILLADNFEAVPLDEPLSVTMGGLFNGVYDFYWYSTSATQDLAVNGVRMPNIAGGSEDAVGAEGTNWGVLQITIEDGTLVVEDRTIGLNELAGIQLVFVQGLDPIFMDGFE